MYIINTIVENKIFKYLMDINVLTMITQDASLKYFVVF